MSKARLDNLKAIWNISSKPLGKGAYGTVYKATSKTDPNHHAAVKIIDKSKLDKYMKESLKVEVDILKKLDHPHVCKLLELYDEPQYIYMVMELLPGGELYDRLTNLGNPMTEKEAAKIVQKIIKALVHCHDQNIIHRDLKPENIVFDKWDEPKLVDFGLAIEQPN